MFRLHVLPFEYGGQPNFRAPLFELRRLTNTDFVQAFEFENTEYNPAWRFVGRHLHWTDRLLVLAHGYLRHALNIRASEEIPPVSHIRLTLVGYRY